VARGADPAECRPGPGSAVQADPPTPAEGPVEPAVSVLIPCWNAERSIEAAIASVLSEVGAPVDCVVVDDGSTDGTVAVVNAIAARDPRVVLVESPVNAGVSAARNRGLRAVRGEWLTFLDADDVLLPGWLQALHGTAVATDALAVVGQRVWTDGVQTWISPHYDRPDVRRPGRKSLAANPGLLYYASATGKLINRSCWEGLEFEGRILGDQPWTIRALLRAGDRIEVVSDTIYQWNRPRPGSDATSITAAKRSSARTAAAAVLVAVGAVRQVADEAERVIADPVVRLALVGAYVERLVSSDFTGPVVRSVALRDDGAAELLAAIAAFLRAAPQDAVGSMRPVLIGLALPPLLYWWKVPGDARTSAMDVVTAGAGAAAAARSAGLTGIGWRILGGIATVRRSRARVVADVALVTLSLLAALPLLALNRRLHASG